MENAFTKKIDLNNQVTKLLTQHWAPFCRKKDIGNVLNFIFIDIVSSLEIKNLKWLSSSCDSTLTWTDQVMTRIWLEKFLDDFDSNLTQRALDSDSTNVTQAHHRYFLVLMYIQSSS